MDAEELPDADLEIGATKSNRMVFASGSAVCWLPIADAVR
jgi:hypothetical protein